MVWNPANLLIVGEWRRDGPTLPVEFSRQSKDGRVTLVITEGSKPLIVLWSELNTKSLSEAREMLRTREGVPKSQAASSIGSWSTTKSTTDATAHVIADWAVAAKVDGVVWTALPSKFSDEQITPTSDQVVAYLSGLEGERRRLAEEYIRRAPRQIMTAYRRRIERELGWTSLT